MFAPEESLSLYQLSLTKIAVNFWNMPDVVAMIQKSGCNFKTVQREINEKVTRLAIYAPNVKNDIINRARFVGVQLKAWVECMGNTRVPIHPKDEIVPIFFEYYPARIHTLLSWTSVGNFDHLKNALALINTSTANQMDIARNFYLACFYNMEDVIHSLWNLMNTRTRHFVKEGPNTPYAVFWIRVLLLGRSAFDPLDGFESTIDGCAKDVAKRFFWEKLSVSDKTTQLQNAFPLEEELRQMDSFLFTQLDQERQSFILEKFPYLLMISFLNDAKFELLFKVANSTRVKMLNEKQFRHIFITLTERNFIFHDFWSMGSDAQKNYVISEFLKDPPPLTLDNYEVPHRSALSIGECRFFLQGLFEIGDVGGIELILKNIDTHQRTKMMEIYQRGRRICVELILHKKWELLRFYGREFVTSKEACRKLERDLDEYFYYEPDELARADEWSIVEPWFFAYVWALLNFRVPGKIIAQTSQKELEESMDSSSD